MENDALAGAIGKAVIARREGTITQPRSDELTIAIGTYPSASLSLATETRLAKAALLYADRVVLYSATAAALSSTEQLGRLDDDGMIALLRQFAPLMGDADVLRGCDLFEDLRRRRHRSRNEIVAIERFRSILRATVRDFAGVADELMARAGAAELAPALAAGLVDVDPITAPNSASGDDFAAAYFMKLRDLLSESPMYPLFDDETGDLLRSAVAEGVFDLSRSAERRGKHAAVAAGFIGRMPALPLASMAEVIEVRRELYEPLARFRGAVIRFSRLVESHLLEDDLAAEVGDLYTAEVAPALEDIRGAFKTNRYLRELASSAAQDVEKLISYGAALTLGLAGFTDLPTIAATAIGVASAMGSNAVRTSFTVGQTRGQAKQNQLYFLYNANERLSR